MTAATLDRSRPTPPTTPHGLDRSTLTPAAWILAVVLVFVLLVPAVNTLVQRDSPIPVGTVYPVGMDVTFTPDSSWSYADRAQSPNSTGINGSGSVTSTGVTFDVATGGWGSTLRDLDETVNRQVRSTEDLTGTTSSTTVTSPQGVTGVLTTYQGAGPNALVYAFLHEGAAVEVVVKGPATALTHVLPSVHRMVDSITFPREPSTFAREAITTQDRSSQMRAEFEKATERRSDRDTGGGK